MGEIVQTVVETARMIVPSKEDGLQKHVRIQPDVWADLEAICGRSGRSMNNVIDLLLRAAILQDRAEHAAVEPMRAPRVKKKD
jgi:hypothetical protein